MSVLFQDDFSGTLAAWTQLTGNSTQISGGTLIGNGSGAAGSYPTGITITTGYVQAKITSLPSSGGNGLYLGKINGSSNGYALLITDNTTSSIVRFDSGSATTLGATFSSPTTNQTVRVERDDTTGDVRLYYDGVLQTTRNDTNHTGSGNCDVVYLTLGSGAIDYFECGSLDSPAFGNLRPFGSSSPNSDNRAWLSKFTATVNMSVSAAVAHFGYDSANTNDAGDTCKVVIYADSAGAPGALIGVSSAVAVPGGYQQVSFPISCTVPIGDFWMGVVSNSFHSRINYRAGGTASVRKESLTYASPADPMGTPDATSDSDYGLYLIYTEAPSGPQLASTGGKILSVAGGKMLRVA